MKINKFISKRKLTVTALLIMLLCCVFLGYSIIGDKKADALNAVPTSTTVETSIYDFENYCYSQSALNDMAQQILNVLNVGGTKDFNTLKTYARTTAGQRGVAIATNTVITLKYGRYRFTDKSSYKNLIWMPVYLSQSKTGDPILTLYLAATENSNGSTSMQEADNFSHDSTYSSDQSNAAPSNSYGTSFMRTVSLGNAVSPTGTANQYATYDESHSSYYRLYNATLKESNYNKFTDFVRGSKNTETGEYDFVGTLYDDIATPSELVWQETESYAESVNDSAYSGYIWPNEAYGTPASGTYYQDTYFDYNRNNKINYNAWQYDKVWLPSLTEVGTGDIAGNGTDTTNGIWKLTAAKRSNRINSWLRTANTTVPNTGSYSTYTMFAMDSDGNPTSVDVNQTAAIRPAIHLNLNKLSDKTIAPVNLPEVVTSIYSGGFQSAAVIPEDQRKWYSAEDMTISFYYDENCSDGTVPLNAGEYYMMVELNSNSKRYFRGEAQSVKQKRTKFIVEKVKLGVAWTYEDDSSFAVPTGVDIVGEFYERDIIAGNIPEIGMRYSNITGAGIQNSPEWPDKIGWYTASAYIIDENLHNYNYEIISDQSAVSHQFEVLQKKIGQPYFLRSDTDRLSLGYKGKQYVQIGNISDYVSIQIEASASGTDSSDAAVNSAAALEKIVDMGVVDGIQTYVIEAVASYTFTITLKDTINTVWDESGTDTSPRYLYLGIEKADITVSFDGLPSSWERGRTIEFDLDILGVYNTSDIQELEFNVSYYINGTFVPVRVPYDSDKGKYVFRANTLDVGEYYVYAVLAGTSQWTGNYRMTESKTQKFTIRETVSNFNSSLVRWQYTLNGEVSANTYPFDLHDSESKALTVSNTASTGYYYEFALSISQQRLRDQYFVKASYTGDTYVRDAGMHSVTVVISAYDKNVVFESLTFTIYFQIEMAEFDLSGVQWNYTSPYTYSGSEYKVMIDPVTLPAGLTAEYTTGGTAGNSATDAGSYTTLVRFLVSDEYAVNYKTPAAADYTGVFSFVLNWEIEKQEIVANWNTENASGDIFFVPSLQVGHNFVDYSYEHFENGAYAPCTGITSTSSTEKYKVIANLKPLYAANYTLSGDNFCEFDVAPGQFAVTVYTEVNGTRCEDGAEFVFNGSAFTVRPVVGNGNVTISNYNVTYSDGDNNALDGAPVNYGTYRANISVTFSGGNNVTFQNQTQFNFTVKKADVDTSSVRWTYTHGDTYLEVRYDPDQKKWVDLNGKELNFAFEYDGTEHKLQLIGDESVSGLMVNNVQDVTGTAAGSHTAYINWTINPNYNDPEFPQTFSWSIVPAKVNFENVKWGYIDENGAEREFTSDDYSFLFTRDDDKNAVPYTVALINLPNHIKHLFTYTTTSQTDRDFGTVTGNSFSKVAEYHTEVSVSGTWTDPSGNTEPFSADKFPANILRFIDWEIKPREFTAPNYDGSWTIFDDKDHNLIELTGIPEDELNYLNVEITFVDKANTIYNNFTGYNGIPYNAHDAGTYIVRFYELVDEVVNGETVVNNYILWQVEVEVGKEELEVIWDKNGAIPVARVKGIYVSEMLGTAYYVVIKDENGEDKKGARVDLTYIESTDGEVSFIAEPIITAKYDKNLTFVMANNESRTITFWHEKYESTEHSAQLTEPVLETDEIEYTGNPITFKINNWDYEYKDYLYISDGDLTQTEIGEYTVRISFIKNADAYWFGTADDRSYRELTFKIIAPTKQPLGYPLFDKYTVEYTGATHEFRITNWVELQRYVDYEVFFQGQSQGTNLSHSRAGVYSVVFKFKDGSIGYWSNDPDNPKKDYTVQFQIVDPNATEQEIMNPSLQSASKPYTGSAVEFTVDKWESYYAAYLEVSGFSDGVTVNGGTFSAVNVGSYDVYLSIKAEGVTFSGGATTCTLTFIISVPTDNKVKVPLQKPVFSADSQPYTGNIVEFRIANWESIGYANYLEITCDNENVSISGGVIKAVEAGEYTVTVKFKDGANAEWLGGGTDAIALKFNITEGGNTPGKPTVLPLPSLMETAHEFNGKEITFAIKNWEVYSNYVEVAEGSLTQVNVGVYTVILRLKDENAATWAGGLTNQIPLTFEITAAHITVDKDENGNIVIKNSSGDDVDLNEYLDIKYFDPETGDEVSVENLVDGKTYNVKYSVKEDKAETFNKNVENAGDVIKNFEENTYNITYVKPSGGLNLVIIIIIVSAVVLLILIVVVIIVIKKRRDSYEDYEDYDENYDEYEDYDEYDDYDDYDDYDEYDDDEY